MKFAAVIFLIWICMSLGGGCSTTETADTRPAEMPASGFATKTITGINECASCEGVTASDDDVLLVEKGGTRWLLLGSGPAYKAAQDGHNEGKTITATLAGMPVTKTGLNGKEYKQVKVSDIRIVG